MELFLEFLLTVFVSLVLSFILSKLFSVSSCFSSSCSDDHVSVLCPQNLVIKKLVSCESLLGAESKKIESGGEMEIGFVSEVVEVESRNEKIENQESLDDSGRSRSGFKIDENEVFLGQVSEFEEKLVVESRESEKVTNFEEDLIKDEVVVVNSGEIVVSEIECGNEILEANKRGCEEILVDGSGNSELSKEETLLDADDDWEGIERTELERLFGSAVAFVGSKSNADRISSLASPVKMKLYGLHKIATQGPCHEPQPMALKVSARANWNAWKSLGNMTREDAMEQYVTILSRSIPECVQDDSDGHSILVSADSEACCKLPSDLKAWQMNIVRPVDERNVDKLMPSTEGLDMSKSSIQMH